MTNPIFTRVVPYVPAGDDFDNVLTFYEKQLGFNRQWLHGGLAGLRCGDVEIILQKFGDKPFRENYMFRIQIADIEAYHGILQARNVGRLGALETKPWGGREFHVIDPAGVCIHFYK